ncbi:TPA: hypothetical protein JFP82_002178 [Vibrio cholerae O1]|uniref:hypothetical protein n=1 Tax=Vibrio cholerae TaxID=666 RepID=UPI0006812E0C|nr:hypothetical protein [Vibrio cholerae]HAU9839374.1 hypothetical protein [Vibrio cholerae O1]
MQFKTRLFMLSAMAFSLASCSSGYDKSSATTSDKYQELSVSAVYYPARNDVNPSLSNKVVFSTLLNQHGSEKNRDIYILLGHSVAAICKEKNDCSQSSNLATLDYIVKEQKDGLVIYGQMTNETGQSTTSSSDVGFITWSINDGAKLYLEGTFEQKFSFPVVNGNTLTIEGKLGDKLVLTAGEHSLIESNRMRAHMVKASK